MAQCYKFIAARQPGWTAIEGSREPAGRGRPPWVPETHVDDLAKRPSDNSACTVNQYPVICVPVIWHPVIELGGSRSLRTHQRAAADDRAERTHLIGPIQQTTGSSRRQRIYFLKHKVGYKVHKGAIQADIDCTVCPVRSMRAKSDEITTIIILMTHRPSVGVSVQHAFP